MISQTEKPSDNYLFYLNLSFKSIKLIKTLKNE